MGTINELFRFIELSEKLHPDYISRYEKDDWIYEQYCQSLRTIKEINWDNIFNQNQEVD